MKTIGLIGGMSWESTASYYRLINQAVKARLQRVEPATDPDAYQALFADLLALESYRRGLREQVAGGSV